MSGAKILDALRRAEKHLSERCPDRYNGGDTFNLLVYIRVVIAEAERDWAELDAVRELITTLPEAVCKCGCHGGACPTLPPYCGHGLCMNR